MTDPRHSLYWIAGVLIALALISIAAWWQERRAWLKGPATSAPPRASLCKRLRRWIGGGSR